MERWLAPIRRLKRAVLRPTPVDPVPSPPSPWAAHQDHRYRAPHDLRRTPTPPLKVLIVGSCLMETLANELRAFGHGVDHVLFNNVWDLPDRAAADILAYDLQIVQIPIRTLAPESLSMALRFDDMDAYQALQEHAFAMMDQMVQSVLKYADQTGVLTFYANFVHPQQNPMGRLLPRYDIRNPVHFTERLNRRLNELMSSRSNVHLLDLDQISATFGRMHHQDDHLWLTRHGGVVTEYDQHYDQNRIHPAAAAAQIYALDSIGFLRAVCNEVEALFRTVRQIDQVKLVVMDLDDTLWRGVAAEEGRPGEIEGWPLGLAEALAFLKARGMLLAIISKNDEARIEALWEDHFQGRLKLEDFAVRRINWRPKVENMAEVLEATNLLSRSVVFVDDNPVERAAMAEAFPDIRTIGQEPYLLRRILLWSPETQSPVVTTESTRRTEMIQAQAERTSAGKRLSREAFLASLSLQARHIPIARADHPKFERAFELVNKTNQFNTTGRRWTQAEMTALFAAGGALHAFEVEDRYSHYGLTGVAVVRGAVIEQFVMSCRVVGMEVEILMLAEVGQLLKAAGHGRIEALSQDTDANLLSRDLYARAGFAAEDGRWARSLDEAMPRPAHANVVREKLV